jgi:hypothetical protein
MMRLPAARLVLLLPPLLTATAPLQAQDAFLPGFSPMENMAPMMGAIASAQINSDVVQNVIRQNPNQPGPRHGARTPPSAPSGAGAQAAASGDARFPFTASPALRTTVRDSVVGRLSAGDAQAAASLKAQLTPELVDAQYRQAATPYGLSPTDAADTLAAYMVLGWSLMNGREPTPEQVRGARRQVAVTLARDRVLQDPVQRATLGERCKLLFVLVGGGAQAAQQKGQGAPYAAALTRLYQRNGGADMRGWGLTATGFQPRG